MKINFAKEVGRAEFCGTHYETKEGELTGRWCPDVPRMIKNWPVSTTAQTIENFRQNRVQELRKTRISPLMSRAYNFAGILPSLSNKFLLTTIHERRLYPSSSDYVDDEICRCFFEGEQVGISALEQRVLHLNNHATEMPQPLMLSTNGMKVISSSVALQGII